MADVAKYMPINGGTSVVSDFKNLSSIIKTRRTVAFFMFAFVGFTVFIAFSPSTNSSSPWVSNIFSVSSTSSSTTSANSYRSQFPSLLDYFFSNTSSPQQQQGLNFTSSASSSSSFSSSSNNYNNARSNNSAPHSADASEELHSDKNTNKTQSLNKNEGLPSSKNTTFHSPNTSINNTQTSVFHPNQTTVSPPSVNKSPPSRSKQGEKKENSERAKVLKANTTTIVAEKAPLVANQSTNSAAKSDSSNKVSPGKGENHVAQKGVVSNYTASLTKSQGNGKNQSNGIENLIASLMSCDLFDGGWVKDNSYPLYKPGSCSFIDEQFSCITNGRPDKDYQKLKWKPKGCTLPRLNGGHMLELLRGKRLVFVGDSLNRNMWESLVCILRGAAKKPENVYEANGRHNFRGEASYSFIFKDYNCTVEFFVSPFLVREWEMPDKNGSKKETLRLDLVGRSSDQYKSADILIFNTGHWWTHEKTSKGKDYYQEGSHVYNELNVLEAFRKALTTWARWIDANVNPMKSMVFFRGYSASHFSGGQWNSGGACDSETEPIRNETFLTPYPPKMLVLESVLKGMKTHVTYLNITRLTDFRKDGHPSIYRKHPNQQMSEDEKIAPLKYQDCSHWCLPGVPDSWNELLYAELLVKENKMRQHQRRAR